jgi:hypothetical protein
MSEDKVLLSHQQRVVDEEKALAEKVVKLGVFIGGEAFKELDPEDQRLLKKQFDYMDRYRLTLSYRIKRF